MKILALDIATRTGVAVGISGGAPRAWTVDLGKGPDARRFSKVISLTSELIATHQPDLVAVEAPIGGKKVNAYLIGLEACVRGVCDLRRARSEAVHLASVRKHFLGKALTARDYPGLSVPKARAAIKRAVMDRCVLLGWDPQNDDEGDAMALWDYACATWARGYQAAPVGGLFTQKTGTGA